MGYVVVLGGIAVVVGSCGAEGGATGSKERGRLPP